MKIALIFALGISVFASESCYTIQLISKYNSKNNMQMLQKIDYPKACKIMEIGSAITVRCECIDEFKLAKGVLAKYKQDYKDAILSQTYKYRFQEHEEKVLEPQTIPVVQNKEKTVLEPLNNKKSEDINKTVVKKQVVAIKEKKAIAKEEKKVKKKKEKKKKYKKKRDARYPYTRSIDKLSNKEGIGKFDYRYSFGAQFSYDLSYINEADRYYLENDWRRVRVGHEGSFFDETLFYSLEYSFTGNDKYKDIYLGYTNSIEFLNTNYRVKYGNIKIPFSLERYSSSKNITFMERGLNDAFADGRKLGGELFLSTQLAKSRINLFAAAFSNSIDERIEDEINQPGYTTRATYAYKFDKRHLVSFGGAYMVQDMKGEDVKLNQSSESEFIDEKYVSVKIADVDTMIKNNIEFLYIYDNYSLQTEYTRVVTESLLEDYSFDGYYVQGSYFLRGKGRSYKTKESKFGKIKPNKDGAIELAFRYSHIDLNDKDEHGGTQTDYTYALNWYYSEELKFMFNYIVAQPKGTDEYDGRLQIVQARALFAF